MDAMIYNAMLMELMKLSKNKWLIQSLSRKHNPAKLEYELGKLKKTGAERRVQSAERRVEKPVKPVKQVASEVASGKRQVASVERVKIIRNDREVKYDELPPSLQKLVDWNRDSYKEIRALHEKLKLMEKANPEDRQPLIERITELDNGIRENWKVVDAWEPGQEPEEKPKAEIDHKRINSNRKYISTNVKRLATLEGKKAAALREKIQERVDELVAAGEELKGKTKEELKNSGINI